MIWFVVIGVTLAGALVYLLYTLVGPVSLPVQAGMPAPLFGLPDQEGRLVRLTDFKDKSWVLLYFYPKDDTPGCTKEACGLRDRKMDLSTRQVQVLGISLDSVDSHQRFAKKFQLPFPLLSDTNHTVCRSFGTLINLFGVRIPRRSSFLIDPSGRVRKVFTRVDPARHAQEVIETVQSMTRTARPGGEDRAT